MKYRGLLVLAIPLGLGWLWLEASHRSLPEAPRPQPGPRPSSEAKAGPSLARSGPEAVPTLGKPQPEPSENLASRLQSIASLSRFALPSAETRASLLARLADPVLQRDLVQALEASDRHPYDASEEKLRMNAVSVLGLMLRHRDLSHREELLLAIKQRILAVDFDSMKDLRVKKSVYGDITELLMILKQHDAETFEELAQRIGEANKKVLKTALATSR